MPSADNHNEKVRVSSRLCSIGVVLLFLGSLTLWNTAELFSFLVGNGEEMLTTKVNRSRTVKIEATSHSGAITVRISNKNGSFALKRPANASKLKRNKASPVLYSTKTTSPVLYSTKTTATNNETTGIPEALLPVTTSKCCGEGNNAYEQTCLTRRACENETLYPFTSLEEKNLLQLWTPRLKQKIEHRKRCVDANLELQPPTTWCGGTTNTSHPFGCSPLIGWGGGSGPYDRMIVFPKNKFLFCGVPKAGITQWLQFLRFTMGAADYQSLPYFKKDTTPFYFDQLIPRTQIFMWNTYTKAILIRDPAERLLSAYLDKVANNTGKNSPFGPNVTFTEFVDILSTPNITKGPNHRINPGLTFFSDPHWRPQAWSCGLSEHIQNFDYIGTLDNAAYHTKALLESVGLWETHGRHYRVSKPGRKRGNLAMRYPPPPLLPNETAVGFQQEENGMDTFKHHKDSHSKIDDYYTPELMKKVKELYWMDFKLWDALQLSNKQGVVHGKDIGKLLNPECGR
jgi:hypothetical protein